MNRVEREKTKAGPTRCTESNPLELAEHTSARSQKQKSESKIDWATLAVLVLTAILYLVRLGSRALWASEFRWAEIAREMLLTRNYFWPTINGRLYFDKPLGSYWMVLASTAITGGVNEAAARLPAAISGLIAVALLILLARYLYGVRTGAAAGLILATSLGFAFWARTASADTETVAGELATLVIFTHNQNRAGWWIVPMWLTMALTASTKGLLGFVLPIAVIGVYCCIKDGWTELELYLMRGPVSARIHWLIESNRWFFNWRTSFAVALAGIIYLTPFVLSYAGTGSATGIYMVYRENLERYFTPFDHRGPIYLYVYVVFGLMVPWSAFLPAALLQAHSGPPPASVRMKSDRFVLAFFWATLVFFTLSGSRRSYYILPILPAAAILVARIFVVAETDLSKYAGLLLKGGFGLVLSALILSVIALLPPSMLLPAPYSFLPRLPQGVIFTGCWILSVACAVYAFIRYSRQRVFFSMGLLSYLFLFYLFVFAMPAGDKWRSEKPFAEATRRLINGQFSELASFKTQAPVFYLQPAKPMLECNTLVELQLAYRSGRIKWVIVRKRDVPALDLPAREVAFERSFPWDSPEHRSNALVLMKLGQPGSITSSALLRTETPNRRAS